MSRKKVIATPREAPAAPAVVLCLYVAEGAPNSLQAVANLAAICKGLPPRSFELEVVDVLTDPLRALADGILVTPSLNKLSPSPPARLVGNLSDRGTVLRALGLQT
ncbi:MAG: circadian clock protein KaiB [Rubrivivax sp.]|nr:circadian clock protein KaiB [Rubrivivax sp.]